VSGGDSRVFPVSVGVSLVLPCLPCDSLSLCLAVIVVCSGVFGVSPSVSQCLPVSLSVSCTLAYTVCFLRLMVDVSKILREVVAELVDKTGKYSIRIRDWFQ
jgi:hypothetical protein